MSAPHSHGSSEGSNPVKLAIVITLVAVALVVAIIMVAQFAIGSYGMRSLEGHPAMSPEAVARRISPVAQVKVDPNAPAITVPAAPTTPPPVEVTPATAQLSAPTAAVKGAAGGAGKATYDAACAMCHTAGVAGAPKLGDKSGWAARLKEGKDHLYASALKGKGAMPPKGGNAALTDEAVKAAVDYMVEAAK